MFGLIKIAIFVIFMISLLISGYGGQKLKMMMDTGTSNLWVSSSKSTVFRQIRVAVRKYYSVDSKIVFSE